MFCIVIPAERLRQRFALSKSARAGTEYALSFNWNDESVRDNAQRATQFGRRERRAVPDDRLARGR
jgi:hypothetical protein